MKNAFNLPNLGGNIDYDEPFDGYNAMKQVYDQASDNYDIFKRLKSGQIGPEVMKLVNAKKIGNGSLDLNVNVLRPYMGFTYRF